MISTDFSSKECLDLNDLPGGKCGTFNRSNMPAICIGNFFPNDHFLLHFDTMYRKMDANNITVLELRARCFADQNMYR